MSNLWLFKTEPKAYSYEKLQRDGRTVWDGVRNNLALKHLALVKKGDRIMIYHTGNEKAVLGIAKAVSGPYPDPAKKDKRMLVLNLEPVKSLKRPVALAEMKGNAKLAKFDLLRLPRLSIMPVSAEQWKIIERMAAN